MQSVIRGRRPPSTATSDAVLGRCGATSARETASDVAVEGGAPPSYYAAGRGATAASSYNASTTLTCWLLTITKPLDILVIDNNQTT